jgi:hypothetical protein
VVFHQRGPEGGYAVVIARDGAPDQMTRATSG